MALSAAAIFALASQCAPNVAPQTVAAIVQSESRGRPFALNVNGGSQPPEQTDALSAAATARRYVAAGYSVDLGLGQVNSRNMRALGLTWETVFDPCTNIAALGRVLTQNYSAAINGRDPQDALRVALSLYMATSISIEIVRKFADQTGFVVHPRRWVVERTFAWLNRNRRLAKDFEHTIRSATAFLYAASAMMLIRRLARYA